MIRGLLHYDDDQPPAAPVSPVVKLICHVPGYAPEMGTGFMLGPPTQPFWLFTARHVLRIAVDVPPPSRIQVGTSDGTWFDARAFAHPPGEDNLTDCAVLLIRDELHCAAWEVADTIPSGPFSLEAVGFPGASSSASTVDLAGASVTSALVYFDALSDAGGMSGGPLIHDHRVLGMLIRESKGLALFETPWPQRCIDAIEELFAPGIG